VGLWPLDPAPVGALAVVLAAAVVLVVVVGSAAGEPARTCTSTRTAAGGPVPRGVEEAAGRHGKVECVIARVDVVVLFLQRTLVMVLIRRTPRPLGRHATGAVQGPPA
jgi:hypothetical protein